MQNRINKESLNIYPVYVRKKWLENGFEKKQYREPSLAVDGYEITTDLLMALWLFIGSSGIGSLLARHSPHIPAGYIEMQNTAIQIGKAVLDQGSVYVPNGEMGIRFLIPVSSIYCNASVMEFCDWEKEGHIEPIDNPFFINPMVPIPQLRPQWELVYIVSIDSLDSIREHGIRGGYVTKTKHEAEQLCEVIIQKNNYRFMKPIADTLTIDLQKFTLFAEKCREKNENRIIQNEIKKIEADMNAANSLYISEVIHRFIETKLIQIASVDENLRELEKSKIKLDLLRKVSKLNIESDFRAEKIFLDTNENEWRYNQDLFAKYITRKIPELKEENLYHYIFMIKEPYQHYQKLTIK